MKIQDFFVIFCLMVRIQHHLFVSNQVQVSSKEIRIRSTLFSDETEYQFFLIASLSRASADKNLLKYNVECFGLQLFKYCNRVCWLELLLLLSGNVELNPGPKLPARLQDCLLFGAGHGECAKLVDYPQWITVLLRDMTLPVDDEDMHLPQGFTECDLVFDRIRCEHPDLVVSHATQLCPYHRYHLGIGRMKENKRRPKGKYGTCRWKDHFPAVGADRVLSYNRSWQLEEKTGERRSVGTPACPRCSLSWKGTTNENNEQSQLHYEQEKSALADLLEPPAKNPDSPQQVATPTHTTPVGPRAAAVYATEMIQNIFMEPPGSADSIPSMSRSFYSPVYGFSEPSERLSTFNASMKSIAELSGRQWERMRFLLGSSIESVSSQQADYVTKVATNACSAVCNAIAPGQEMELLERVHQRLTEEHPAEARRYDPILNEVLNAIESVPSYAEQIILLSQICDNYSARELQEMSNGSITNHMLKKARAHREQMGAGTLIKSRPIVRHKLDMGKVSHFFTWLMDHDFLQLMSWGKMSMKFSSGETATFGKVVLQNCRAQLIRWYVSHCSRVQPPITPLSERTLFKLFEQVKFSERHSMSGLDYVSADANCAFDTLKSILTTLERHGLSKEKSGELQAALKSSKLYLKGEYMLDVASLKSTCAHHCRQLALSDPKVSAFQATCTDHQHTESCASCELILSTLDAIELEISTAISLSPQERQDIEYDFKTASAAVWAQKNHIIRGIHQQEARRRVIDSLNESSGLLIFDYAMKFLQIRYREKQTDWFGKKGLSWEVFTFFTRQHEDLVKSTYIVFFTQCNQDAATSAAAYQLVLSEIEKDFPKVVTITDKSDNASYYRNVGMLLLRRQLTQESRIRIVETHNNEPQRGKDQPDRDAALVKTQLIAYNNSGHDILTAADMKQGCDVGGLTSIKTVVVAANMQKKKKVTAAKLPHHLNITDLHSFRYEEDGIRVWRFEGIGEGILIPYGKLPPHQFRKDHLQVEEPFQQAPPVPSCIAGSSAARQGEMTCDYPFCNQRFLSQRRLEEHLVSFDHSTLATKENTSDHVKQLWIRVIEGLESAQPRATMSVASSNIGDVEDPCSMGFALKGPRTQKRLNAKQKGYLAELFWEGQRGHTRKADPVDVQRQMRRAVDEDDNRLFSAEEWLTNTQIARYFSIMSADLKASKIQDPLVTALSGAAKLPTFDAQELDEDEENERIEDGLIWEHRMVENDAIGNIMVIDGTLALEAGDYCAFTHVNGQSWGAGKVIEIQPSLDDDDNVKVQFLERIGSSNNFQETSEIDIVNSKHILDNLPDPESKLNMIRAPHPHIEATLTFPVEICKKLDKQLLEHKLSPIISPSKPPRYQGDSDSDDDGGPTATSSHSQAQSYKRYDLRSTTTSAGATKSQQTSRTAHQRHSVQGQEQQSVIPSPEKSGKKHPPSAMKPTKAQQLLSFVKNMVSHNQRYTDVQKDSSSSSMHRRFKDGVRKSTHEQSIQDEVNDTAVQRTQLADTNVAIDEAPHEASLKSVNTCKVFDGQHDLLDSMTEPKPLDHLWAELLEQLPSIPDHPIEAICQSLSSSIARDS